MDRRDEPWFLLRLPDLCAGQASAVERLFNHFSLYFADVVWTGLSTRHICEGINGHISLDQPRGAWKAITPLSYVYHYAIAEDSL